MQDRLKHHHHPGINISSIGYHPKGSQNQNKMSKIRNSSLNNSKKRRRSNNTSNFKQNSKKFHHSMKRKYKKGKKENYKQNSEIIDNNGIQFDSRGYGRTLRNSYYLMHHKQMFYQTLMKDNNEYANIHPNKMKETDKNMDKIYNGEIISEEDRDIYKRGLVDTSERRMKFKPDLNLKRKPKINSNSVQMSLNIINTEMKNLSRKKKKRFHQDSKFIDDLNRRTMKKNIRDNEMVSNITVGILRKEIEKNLKELKKTHKKLIEVEQAEECTKPVLKPNKFQSKKTGLDEMRSSKLHSLNTGLQRPHSKIYVDQDVLLLTKEAQQNQKGTCFPSNQEDDYLNTVLKKKVENNVINDQTSRNERVSNFKRMFTNQVDQNEGRNIKMLNQKVEDKTFIRGLLGTVGKSHLAENFFDKTNIKINENPDSLAQELYESIKIQQKFDNVRPNENFDYFSSVNNNNNILLGTNKEDLKNSLKIDKYQKSKFGQSIAMKNTQNNMNTYLNSVLKGNNQNFSYYDNEPIPEKKEVFSYLNSLQNTFDLKKSFYKSKNQNYSGNYFLFKIIS